MNTAETPAGRYFEALGHALDGLETFLAEEGDSPLYRHDVIGAIASQYLKRLRGSLESWRNRIAFGEKFQISRAESGFPAFQHVLELENDRKIGGQRLAELPREAKLREEMVEFILTRKQFPAALQKNLAERRYLESVQAGSHFSPLVLPQTVRLSVNPKSKRPYYITHWGYYDGAASLPLVYVLSVEDSTPNMVETLVTKDGKLNREVEVPLPVEGLLNPELAHRFDDFCEKNSAYSLSLSTIATNMDKDFETLHPKQLRRFVLGPFYHAGITVHGSRVDRILENVRRPENRWLLTWTLQEIYSVNEKPAKWGLWGGQAPREEYFIDTNNLECARMGVSAFQRHALVPHDAYQAIYAAGEEKSVFDGYQTHIITGSRVLRQV